MELLERIGMSPRDEFKFGDLLHVLRRGVGLKDNFLSGVSDDSSSVTCPTLKDCFRLREEVLSAAADWNPHEGNRVHGWAAGSVYLNPSN